MLQEQSPSRRTSNKTLCLWEVNVLPRLSGTLTLLLPRQSLLSETEGRKGGNFLKFIYLFYLRMITLQYCDGFCHTSIWISYRHTCVTSLLNLPPTFLPTPSLQVVTSTGFGFPVSYIKLPLAIFFTYCNIYISMLFSQIIPASPSLTDSKNLFCVCVSFAALHIGSYIESSVPSF